MKNEYDEGEDARTPNAKKLGEPIIVEEKKDFDYQVSIMKRVTGYLEGDLFLLHVKHAGLKIFKFDTGQLKLQ